MTAFRIGPDELDLLAKGPTSSRLSHEAKVCYLLGIRPYMDYASGIAGAVRVISYQGLSEVLEYVPARGSTNAPRTFHKQRIRAVLDELERFGVVERIRNGDRGLFFRCLLADTDQSARNEEQPSNNPRTTPKQQPHAQPHETASQSGIQREEQPKEQPSNNPIVQRNEQPTSGSPEIPEGQEKERDSLRSSPKKEKPPAARFCPPTIEDIRAYCIERNNTVDPERFHAYYESNGWHVGRTKMRNWKAAVRTWESRTTTGPPSTGNVSKLSPVGERTRRNVEEWLKHG